MIKISTLLLVFVMLSISCAHNNFDDHNQQVVTGWSKDQIMRQFGAPLGATEDSDASYYIYNIRKKKSGTNKSRLWEIIYVFKYNKVVDVKKQLVPTAAELDELEKMNSPENDKNSQYKDL